MRASRLPLTAVAAVAAVVLAGCANDDDTGTAPESANQTESASVTPAQGSATPDESPTESEEPEPAGPVVEIRIEGDSVQPVAEQVKLGVGDTLTLKIDSDRAGELHVHSTPEQYVQFTPGSREYEVVFDKPGAVDIEEHDSHVLLVRALVS